MRLPPTLAKSVLLTGVVFGFVSVLEGCGGAGEFNKAVPANPRTILGPTYAGLPAYERRCAKIDARGAEARVVYEPRATMSRGDSSTVTAAVTLNQSIPRDRVLHRPGAAEEPGVVVSCRVQARLSASHYDFDVSTKQWIERSLQTTDTAKWSWFVTPKLGGTHSIVLLVRPIMRFGSAKLSPENSNIRQYETSVHVKVPWNEMPNELMSQLAETFKVAEGLVTAATALIIALVALAGVLGFRKVRKNKRQRNAERPRAAS
jgi:hypothetical protein